MFDPTAFLKPIAHRGLHDRARGRIENTAEAFAAGLARGYGIECDLQPAADGMPMVFHDFDLDRLVAGTGPIRAQSPADLARLAYQGSDARILGFAGLLELAAGRGPLLVEIKSDWARPAPGFLEHIARLSTAYRGPLALMSFDPAVMAAMRDLAPAVPRGIISGLYKRGDDWGVETIGDERAERLSQLLESRAADPQFYAYHVKALPTPVTRYVREVAGVPLLTWTVRSQEDRATAAAWADAPIFEGFEP